MDLKSMNKNFSIEELLTGKLSRNNFQIDYQPLWHFLDNMEKRVGGFDKVTMKEILEAVYEFALISVSLDKADLQTRIDYLSEQNIKWYTKADSLETENSQLKAKLANLPLKEN